MSLSDYPDFWKPHIQKKHRIQIWKAIREDDPNLLPECIKSHIVWWRSAKEIMWNSKHTHNHHKSLLWQLKRGKRGPNDGPCPNILKFARKRFDFPNWELKEAGIDI